MPNDNTTKEENNNEIYGLKKAITTAWDELIKKSTDDVVKRTLCLVGESSSNYIINFLGENYLIKTDEKIIETQSGDQFHNLFKMGILLHYLNHAKEQPLANKLISFRELWGGQEYYYAFNNRVLVPLVETFGNNAEQFVKAAEALGGEKIDKSEYGFKIPALPRVPVNILLWTGDEEVDGSANVLFDATANDQMETEALVWLAVAAVSELKRNTK
jgi:hypothetical protein